MHTPRQSISPIFAAVAFVTVASFAVIGAMGIAIMKDRESVIRSLEVTASLADTLSSLRDAETGQRGFLLTGEDRYLRPYEAALQKFDANFGRLSKWTREGELNPASIQELEHLSRAKLAELTRTIELRREKGFEPALEVVRSGTGKKLMDDIRGWIEKETDHQNARLKATLDHEAKNTRTRTATAGVAAGVNLLFLVWVFGKISREVDRRQAAAMATEEQKRLLEVTLASIGDGVIVTDVQSRVTFLNGEAERLTGWSSASAMGTPLETVFNIVNEQSRLPVENPVGRVLATGRVLGLANHTVLLARDGNEFPIDDSAAPIKMPDGTMHGVVLIFRDVSEQKKAQEALRLVREQLQTVTDTMSAAVTRSTADRFLWVSRGYADWLGKPVDQIIGHTHREVLGDQGYESLRPCIEKVMSGERVELDTLVNFPGIGQRWIHAVYTPTYGPTRIPDGWVGVVSDITDRKRLEDELKSAKEVAEAANRSKDHFFATLSHELRNPLTPALLAAGAIECDEAIPGSTRDSAAIIRRNLELEVRLIDDLLDLTRIARGNLELRKTLIDAHLKVKNALEMCRSEVEEKGLSLVTDLAAEHHHIEGDAGRIQQIILNLVKNAVKFTPAGGGAIEVRSSNPRPHRLRLEVSDHGVGILPEVMPLLFRAFEQGNPAISRNYGGMGLGLSISKTLAELHQGTISVHSDGQGKGATFVVELPTAAPAELSKTTAPAANPSPLTKASILVVDDNSATARLMELFLTRQGHRVVSAESVQTAVEAAQASRFDLLISDIGLPDGSGHELLHKVKDSQPTLRAIALSGYGMEDDIQASRNAGFTEHLTKPVDFKTLQASIARALQA